jgi:hypothetical protein
VDPGGNRVNAAKTADAPPPPVIAPAVPPLSVATRQSPSVESALSPTIAIATNLGKERKPDYHRLHGLSRGLNGMKSVFSLAARRTWLHGGAAEGRGRAGELKTDWTKPLPPKRGVWALNASGTSERIFEDR